MCGYFIFVLCGFFFVCLCLFVFVLVLGGWGFLLGGVFFGFFFFGNLTENLKSPHDVLRQKLLWWGWGIFQ